MPAPDPAKLAAARAAAELVQSGMRVGLGSGSTFLLALEHLARRIAAEGLDILGVPTSAGTASRARELGVPLTTLEVVDRLDLTIDGADEIDPDRHLIKGGGAALVREKIVAAASKEMVVIVGEDKLVDVLGQAFPLPVEVLPFGWRQALARVEALGCQAQRRSAADGEPLLTDNANYILDCRFDGGIPDPVGMEQALDRIPGVLDSGLFTGLAGRVCIGSHDGSVRILT